MADKELDEFVEYLKRDVRPTHRCKVCGALWMEFKEKEKWWWTLISEECGKCCDNEDMGEQIEILKYDEIREWELKNNEKHTQA